MDLKKAQRFLDKVNREFDRMTKRPDDIATIDRDILLDYVRDFYDALLSDGKPEPVQQQTPPAPKPEPNPTRTVRVSASTEPAQPTPPSKPEPTPPTPPPAPPVERITAAPLRTTPVLKASPEVLALFEFGEAKELSEKLVQPVTDIWKAITLNDRLLYTKELFEGDQSSLRQSVEALNQLQGFDAAKAFLIQTVAVKNEWGEERKAEFARDFIKTVRRKFL